MEISALTAFLTPFLPFLLNLGKGAAETATESTVNKFGEAAWKKAQAIWTVLGPKVEAKDNAEAATDVANNPEDKDYQAALRVQLKKLLANDATLANQLTRILESARPGNTPTTQITQTVTGNQNQTIGQISGGQVFGNVTGSVITSGSGNSVTYNSTGQAETKASAAPSKTIVKTILLLAANPKGTTPLRLGEEARGIQAGSERSKYRDRFRIEQRWAVTPIDVRRALLDCSPQIVHFSGHGVGIDNADALSTSSRKISLVSEEAIKPEGLLFEDATGHSQVVSTDAITHLFSLFSDEIECVVLDACYSAVQADAIAQHIPYVVGMKKAIGDKAAIEFSVGFYDALLAGRSVDFSYQMGCSGIQMQGIPEHLTPVIKQKQGSL